MAVSEAVRGQMEGASWIRRMFEEGIRLTAEHGRENVFDLSLGNPLLEPPQEFRNRLLKLVQDDTPGTHRYMPNSGFPDARAAVASSLVRESGIPLEGDDIIMTSGASSSLHVILRSLLDPGDEVVILTPFFVEYVYYVSHNNGVHRLVGFHDDFMPDMDDLEAQLSPRTKAVIMNSPNNPTGVIYPESVVAEIGARIRAAEGKYGSEIALITDEPYRKLIYTDEPYPFVFKHHLRTIVATSHSKDLGLAGERIGYIAINPDYPDKGEMLDAMVFSLRTLGFVNAPALMQRVVAGLQDVTVDVSVYRGKRDFIYDALTDIGYDVVKPDGAFFLFPKSPLEDDVEFVRSLQEKMVLVVPGSGFGAPGYFRLSFGVEDRALEGSLDGFKAALSEARER
ncbi:MAG TPA: pyridoxal phosphate-dependent aminotransferase [Dehalococcoidia bacterium]|jgi:aspartate aminotransferase|nr:aspartate aminotransferase [Chloroflexota bacterium]MDP5876535.1 pyridoxal phosphate-dependent aminotransferase [Dehalococcoidia bacterium]MDP7160875.1 pyridoxal phosphate-dependent aminotransferase [Dehalococcoidia bacterium]MDP7213118.1 pyridoxal phosphate-dependent aminotransferase [Dehalococcoidia bacterium]MDP7513640.1 pyridoxal phosphate-dependent aminotransferase [Dehalococcoidia bacterium]